MTPHEALWLIKTQLQKNEQNKNAIEVLEQLVKEKYKEVKMGKIKQIYVVLQEEEDGYIQLVEAFTSKEIATETAVELAKEYTQDYYIERIQLTMEEE